MMKYPYEIVSYVRKKTFSVDARFTQKTDDKPLTIFENPFSRFIFTIIGENKKVSTCNVPIDLLPDVEFRSNYAYTKQMDMAAAPVSGNNGSSIAYTVRFNTGKLKGKSPMDVMIENGKEAGGKILNDQYKWLKENLTKFPNNQKLMDAIIAASKEEIPTDTAPATTTAPITIMDIGCRPLTRKKRADGKCFCYECKVTWDGSKNYPVSVHISNYYAPVEKKESGMLNVMISAKDKSSEINNDFSMGAAEWMNTIAQMKSVKNGYELAHYAGAFKEADKAAKEAAENAKANKTNNTDNPQVA